MKPTQLPARGPFKPPKFRRKVSRAVVILVALKNLTWIKDEKTTKHHSLATAAIA
jgi:hypothetical protein